MLPRHFPTGKIGCYRAIFPPGKLKYFFILILYDTLDTEMMIHQQSIYQRGSYGRSRFIWTPATLGIIIRGYFQFHRLVPSLHRVSLVQIAPHLRVLIREYVKSSVCTSHFDEHRFERICARWIRIPSLGAVLLKLQECHRIVHSVNVLGLYTYESLRDDRIISSYFYDAIMTFITQHSDTSHSDCRRYALPALPRPSSLPSRGSCFFCGSALTDKIDWNFVPRCECVGYNEEVCVCSSCLDEIADD